MSRTVNHLSAHILEQAELATKQIERSLRILQDTADKFAALTRLSVAPSQSTNPIMPRRTGGCG
ncbi:MAG TPA: hypothetical protein VFQ26_07140, partial [Nitrospiraceae bacterium]|nr:hypothetical protein [Nitrospiraceae bacterium]